MESKDPRYFHVNSEDLVTQHGCEGGSESSLGHKSQDTLLLNPIALRKAKIVYNFGLSECSRVNVGH